MELTDGEILKFYIDKNNVNISALVLDMKMTRQNFYQLYNSKSFEKGTITTLEKGLKKKFSDIVKYVNVNIDEKENLAKEPENNYQQKRFNQKLNSHRRNLVDFYDNANGTASLVETDMSPIHAPSGTIDIGDLLHDSEAAIRIYGNSMLPNYPPGCVVGLARVEKKIQPGEVYVVETKGQKGQRLLKRLFYHNDDFDSEYIILISDNTMKFDGGARAGKLAYPPDKIHIDDIQNLFIVTGVIKRNANSIIMHRNNKT